MQNEQQSLSLIVPCYNEGKNLNSFFNKIIPILKKLVNNYEIICIDDGSKDNTLQILLEQKQQYPQIKIIEFSRNFGKEIALSAGLDYANNEVVIPIDCDLQDPPELIPDMLEKFQQGFDVVLAKRVDRKQDSIAKRFSARCFYKIYNKLTDLKIPDNVGDFRLMSKQVVETLRSFPERKRFMKGLFAWAGFKQTTIEYTRPTRQEGKTKFNCWKLINLAIDGITSFSTMPLRVATYLGLMVSLIAFIYALIIIIRTLLFGVAVHGYASLIVAISFFSGVQLFFLGVLGEYLGRVYYETKQRPLYIVRKLYD